VRQGAVARCDKSGEAAFPCSATIPDGERAQHRFATLRPFGPPPSPLLLVEWNGMRHVSATSHKREYIRGISPLSFITQPAPRFLHRKRRSTPGRVSPNGPRANRGPMAGPGVTRRLLLECGLCYPDPP
jgi:hypothetical protein